MIARRLLSGARGGALFFGYLAWLASACGSPKRNFATGGAGGIAGAVAGTTTGGTAASSAGSDQAGRAGSSPAGGDGGSDAMNGGGAAGMPDGASAAGMPHGASSACSPADQRSCADGGALGSCAHGTQICGADGTWGACSVVPKPDSCSPGNDDSCNGLANEGCTCVDGTDNACVGAKGNCADGKQACAAGVLAGCSIAPLAEDSCVPGDDANCNGVPNEGCACTNGKTQSCGPKAVGNCKPGVSTCSGGAFGACVGAVNKANRDCRSQADNDCDGVADNVIDTVCTCTPGAQQTCGAHAGLDGKGICHAGTMTCVASSDNTASSWGPCTGSVGPAAKDCTSHLDNNCDGALDDAIAGACQCTSSSCPTGTTCKLQASSSQCVACLMDSDCSNGATCSSNACICKSNFNGNRCQYQKFRGLGVPAGDVYSSVLNISPDGSIVVGDSQPSDMSSERPWFFANGSLKLISQPSGNTQCSANATDSNEKIYGACENASFQVVNNATSLIDFSQYTGFVHDVSRDGNVIVGDASVNGEQAIRRVGSTTTLITKLGTDYSYAIATNSDGSLVVGDEYVMNHVAWYWTQKTGTLQLPQLPDFENYDPSDVSADGTVIVGYDSANAPAPRAVKWSGSGFSTIETTPGQYNSTNRDGTVSVGYTGTDSMVATIWNSSGANPVAGFVEAVTISGWALTEATAVSDDGKWIAGNGIHNSVPEPWLVHLP